MKPKRESKGRQKEAKRKPKGSEIGLGQPLGILGRSWDDLWTVLGLSWAALGAILETLGPLLWRSWRPLEAQGRQKELK